MSETTESSAMLGFAPTSRIEQGIFQRKRGFGLFIRLWRTTFEKQMYSRFLKTQGSVFRPTMSGVPAQAATSAFSSKRWNGSDFLNAIPTSSRRRWPMRRPIRLLANSSLGARARAWKNYPDLNGWPKSRRSSPENRRQSRNLRRILGLRMCSRTTTWGTRHA